MILLILSIVSLICALIPAVLFITNLRLYVPPQSSQNSHNLSSVSVLIPARNEEKNIKVCLEAILSCPLDNLECIVLDDDSTDNTAPVVEAIIKQDARVRKMNGKALPSGWNGKQHACWQLAQASKNDYLLFIDADVRLSKDAIPRMLATIQTAQAKLMSGIPRQQTYSLGEKFIVPLIHYALLGFLPMAQMRKSTKPSFAAGIGQLFLAERTAYFDCEGHSAIRASRHDGIKLSRLFRTHDYLTDLFDATPIATCRMYHSFVETWNGFAKNADEAIAQMPLILPVSFTLFSGNILPLWLVFFCQTPLQIIICAATLFLSFLPRGLGIIRFKQSVLSAILHPFCIFLFLCIQWQAFLAKRLGVRTAWKGRST
ncbi:MAG: glycosyltransferase family 2 protein [Verrucomicrobiota bacterium]